MSGIVDADKLLKMNALLDMQDDMQALQNARNTPKSK